MTVNLTDAIDSVALLKLEPGDILHVKVGVNDLGDGQGPWIPGPEEIQEARDLFADIVPKGVVVVATHYGVGLEQVKVPE